MKIAEQLLSALPVDKKGRIKKSRMSYKIQQLAEFGKIHTCTYTDDGRGTLADSSGRLTRCVDDTARVRNFLNKVGVPYTFGNDAFSFWGGKTGNYFTIDINA